MARYPPWSGHRGIVRLPNNGCSLLNRGRVSLYHSCKTQGVVEIGKKREGALGRVGHDCAHNARTIFPILHFSGVFQTRVEHIVVERMILSNGEPRVIKMFH